MKLLFSPQHFWWTRKHFLPTMRHSCGPPSILFVYGFTEHKGNMIWLIIMLQQASADHYHNLMTWQWYTEHSLKATVRNVPTVILFDGGRVRGVSGEGACTQFAVLRGWWKWEIYYLFIYLFIVIFWWPWQSVSEATASEVSHQLAQQYLVFLLLVPQKQMTGQN